ncbi:MAG: hypothetical protein DDT29_00977 [Dehalococcoidia bacterium]|nr:hypothetical protein [Bacillota bacterium]
MPGLWLLPTGQNLPSEVELRSVALDRCAWLGTEYQRIPLAFGVLLAQTQLETFSLPCAHYQVYVLIPVGYTDPEGQV